MEKAREKRKIFLVGGSWPYEEGVKAPARVPSLESGGTDSQYVTVEEYTDRWLKLGYQCADALDCELLGFDPAYEFECNQTGAKFTVTPSVAFKLLYLDRWKKANPFYWVYYLVLLLIDQLAMVYRVVYTRKLVASKVNLLYNSLQWQISVWSVGRRFRVSKRKLWKKLYPDYPRSVKPSYEAEKEILESFWKLLKSGDLVRE